MILRGVDGSQRTAAWKAEAHPRAEVQIRAHLWNYTKGYVFAVNGYVDALAPPRSLAGRLDRGQEQGDQHRDDRDDDQELDQGERASTRRHDNPFLPDSKENRIEGSVWRPR